MQVGAHCLRVTPARVWLPLARFDGQSADASLSTENRRVDGGSRRTHRPGRQIISHASGHAAVERDRRACLRSAGPGPSPYARVPAEPTWTVVDYGHELRFGAFITPASAQADLVVDLAVAAEQAGLDLVTFQDHPYQPRFLDTWTLLSYVAARTERVMLSPNVANLPLRPPAVLGRSAASLDRLSGGRVELGLGAGAFWDAIAALGGPRRTPGQAVAALREAVTVIRAAWERGDTRFDGEYYSSRGAKPGPQPLHDIGIWVGAYGPRMLELVGAVADGWLPSLGRMSAREVVEGNARVDDAARTAGRDPAEIVRLANVQGELTPATIGDWVGRLAELALDQGFSTFIFASDDADGLALVGGEIAPAVRERVAAART